MTRVFRPLPVAAQDVALLAARLIVGSVLIAHGWQKFTEFTLAGTAASFDQMGVPAPEVSAVVAAVIELGAGVLLVAGLFTSVAALLVVLNMAGAFWFVHLGSGVFVTDNGYELVGAIAAAVVVIGAVGAGRLSVDRLIAGRREGARELEDVTA